MRKRFQTISAEFVRSMLEQQELDVSLGLEEPDLTSLQPSHIRMQGFVPMERERKKRLERTRQIFVSPKRRTGHDAKTMSLD